MAAGNRPTGQNRRRKMEHRLREAEKKQNAEMIALYQEALKQRDEQLESLSADQLQKMDIDDEDDQKEEDGDDKKEAEKEAEKSEAEKKEAEKEAEKKAKKTSRKARKSPSPNIMPSIERDESDGSEAGIYSNEKHGRALFSFPGTMAMRDIETVGWLGAAMEAEDRYIEDKTGVRPAKTREVAWHKPTVAISINPRNKVPRGHAAKEYKILKFLEAEGYKIL
ncbi:hypothetical protein B0T26DRAFT_674994 [Lasiosphaeria miniovina]|uniref:Uncharacterized protein n=1 Tax=Lasiosphaeria miniovina TaxID=1954250 RepID=A0AA40AWV9_9PEZI|nr:uncharacterized protein B0T26DRAFT_674994 [Lasiosphaeria miniovina]KAK0723421.1 hypothetical protein B0T26DRAFT_674994 [Lasiosphaeria miniovina]